MASGIGPQPQKDHQRHSKTERGYVEIFNGHHNVVFLVGGRFRADQVKLAQIVLGGLQLDRRKTAVGSRSVESPSGENPPAAMRPGRCRGPPYPGGHQGIWVFGGQGLVNLFFRKLCAVGSAAVGEIVRHPGGMALKSSGRVWSQRHRRRVVPSGLRKRGLV